MEQIQTFHFGVVAEHHKRNAPQAGGALSTSHRTVGGNGPHKTLCHSSTEQLKRRAVAAIRRPGAPKGISGAYPYGYLQRPTQLCLRPYTDRLCDGCRRVPALHTVTVVHCCTSAMDACCFVCVSDGFCTLVGSRTPHRERRNEASRGL